MKASVSTAVAVYVGVSLSAALVAFSLPRETRGEDLHDGREEGPAGKRRLIQ